MADVMNDNFAYTPLVEYQVWKWRRGELPDTRHSRRLSHLWDVGELRHQILYPSYDTSRRRRILARDVVKYSIDIASARRV
jgi:hypothetical protein